MDCSICGNPSAPDALCSAHRRLLATCTDLTPEQIRSRRSDAAELVLVDMFGVVHALGGRVRVGRDPATCELAILHASISSSHALLTAQGEKVTVVDHESLNGTFLAGERVTSRVFPATDTVLRFGAVSFALCPDALGAPGGAPMGRRTVPRREREAHATMQVSGVRWKLSVLEDSAGLAGDGREVPLSLMEGRLLRALLDRSSGGAFVSTGALVAELGFGARAADGENVRELVRRLRRKLDAAGLGELVESRRHAGYRIAPHVAVD